MKKGLYRKTFSNEVDGPTERYNERLNKSLTIMHAYTTALPDIVQYYAKKLQKDQQSKTSKYKDKRNPLYKLLGGGNK